MNILPAPYEVNGYQVSSNIPLGQWFDLRGPLSAVEQESVEQDDGGIAGAARRAALDVVPAAESRAHVRHRRNDLCQKAPAIHPVDPARHTAARDVVA